MSAANVLCEALQLVEARYTYIAYDTIRYDTQNQS